MTCIVGLVSEGKVYIGGDSAGVGGLSLSRRADKKVFRNGDFLMGFTSSFRMGQLLAYSLRPPKRHPDQDMLSFMVTDFIGAVRQCLKDGGFATKVHEEEIGGTFLVGYQGRLFTIDCDYQVGEQNCNYDAVGCGKDIALGSMFASEGVEPHGRVMKALAAAEQFSAGVCGPFTVETLE